jgi:hypothetical protein
MDAVAAAHGGGVFMLQGAALDGGEQRVDIGEHQVGGAGQLDIQAGVEHVGAGHPLVDEARRFTDMFGEIGQKSDDVVLRLAFDLINAGDFELALFPNGLGGIGGDDAQGDQCVHRVRFDFEPDLETGFGFPDGDHFGAGITGDHFGLRGMRGVVSTGGALVKTGGEIARPRLSLVR